MARHAQETGTTMTGALNMGGNAINNVPNATSSNQPVNKGQLDVALPIGTIIAFAGTSGFDAAIWHLCNASVHGSTALQNVLSAAGQSDPTKTPDLRGRFILGSGQGTGLTNRVAHVNSSGLTGINNGRETVQLSTSEMPSHSHTVGSGTPPAGTSGTTNNSSNDHKHDVTGWSNGGGGGGYRINYLSDSDDSGSGLWIGRSTDQAAYQNHQHWIDLTSSGQSANHNHTLLINNTGGTSAHENMPPFYVLTYIIKKA